MGAAGARLLFRGRRKTFCIWSNFCVAGAALRAHGRTLAWLARHFDSLGIAGARLRPLGPGCFCLAGARPSALLRGRRGTLTLWALPVRAWAPLGPGCFCVAGARLSASGATFAWQAQHFVHMDVFFRGRSVTATLWGLLVHASSPLVPVYFSAASAALRAHGCTFAWQVRRFDSLWTVRANGHRRLTYLRPREVLSHTSSHTPHH